MCPQLVVKTKYIDTLIKFLLLLTLLTLRLTVYRKSLEIFPPTAQPVDKKYKTGFLFSNIGIKQGKIGTEKSKIALNAHVHLRTTNQQMSRPERNVDDITDMRRSCRLRENTSGRRPLGSSSRLFKVPNQTKAQNRTPILLRVVYSARAF